MFIWTYLIFGTPEYVVRTKKKWEDPFFMRMFIYRLTIVALTFCNLQ